MQMTCTAKRSRVRCTGIQVELLMLARTPVYNSARMHPKLHISIGRPYEIPKMTSGDR